MIGLTRRKPASTAWPSDDDKATCTLWTVDSDKLRGGVALRSGPAFGAQLVVQLGDLAGRQIAEPRVAKVRDDVRGHDVAVPASR